MAPSATSLLRWSQEEIDILVRMTNEQLELEAQDASMMISWNQHWKKVSSKLKELGHNRSFTACRGIWTRGAEVQRANREAAGPDWDDFEHEILVNMTKKQLDLEKADPSAVIPWAKHWKKVSLQLDESGYDRTPDNCAAYWLLVENGAEIEIGSELEGEAEADDDDQSPEADERVNNEENVLPSSLGVTSPQASSKTSVWSLEEYENLLRLLKARRELEEKEGLEKLSGIKLWTEIAQSHRASGFDRTFEGCKTFWNKQGRDRSGYDERVKPSPTPTKSSTQPDVRPSTEQSTEPSTKSSTKSSSNGSKPSSLSSLWSPVNEADVEESIVVSRNPAIDALKKFQEEKSLDPHVSSPDTNSALPKSITTAVDITESSEHELNPTRKKRGKTLNSSTPTQSASLPEKDYSLKKGLTSFRLTSDQRAILAAEVAKNGGTVTSARKSELARELDVEEKTVRNWFANYNVKVRKSQGSSTPTPAAPTSTYKGFDDDFHSSEQKSTSQGTTPAAATPTPTYKGFSNFDNEHPSKRIYPEDSPPDHSHPSKKTRLEAEVDKVKFNQSGFNPVNGNSSHRPALPQSTVPPNIAQSSRAEVSTGGGGGDRLHVPPASQLTRPPVVPSNAPSGVVESSGFTRPFLAIVKNSTDAHIPPPPIQKPSSTPQPDSLPNSQRTVPSAIIQPKLRPEATSYPTRMIYGDGSDSPNINNEASGLAGRSSFTNNTRTGHLEEFSPKNTLASVNRFPTWAGNRTIFDDGDRLIQSERMGSQPNENTSARHPEPVRTPMPTQTAPAAIPAANKHHDSAASPPKPVVTPSPTKTQYSPNREWAGQFAARNEKQKENSANPKPAMMPAPPKDSPAATPATAPSADKRQDNVVNVPNPASAPSLNSSATPISTPTRAADEDPKVTASRQVQSFRSQIQNLHNANATHSTRINYLAQQLSNFSHRHNELDAKKEAEIARVLREIEGHYETQHASLRQQQEWLEKERETEVEGLKKNNLELSRKEKGLVKWQGIVEYYDTEGE